MSRTTHRKTSKGVAELGTRRHGLSARMRGALILVDGQRSDADILELLGPSAQDLLVELAWKNFIERVPDEKTAARLDSGTVFRPARRALPATFPGSALPGDSPAMRRHAALRLTQLVGPVAQALAAKVERTQDSAELQLLLAEACRLIETMLGVEAASRYRAELSRF